MTRSFGLAIDKRGLTAHVEAMALCLGFLKVAAVAAGELRENYARGSMETPETLVTLLEMMQRTFPNLPQANRVIADIGLRCGFQIEDRNVTSMGEA